MQILWDKEKNKKLISERGLSLEIFASLILGKEYFAVLKNPSRQRTENIHSTLIWKYQFKQP
jgi:uncharacterized DUF497 family protein